MPPQPALAAEVPDLVVLGAQVARARLLPGSRSAVASGGADHSSSAASSRAEGPGPRLLYDVRFVAAAQLAASHATDTRTTASTFRLQLRSAFNLNERHRLNYAVGLESPTLSSTNRAAGTSTSAMRRRATA